MTQEIAIITASGASLPITAEHLFVDGGLDTVLARIEADSLSILTDPTTKKGRDEIVSLAYKVSQSKTLIDKAGKDLTEEWRHKTNKVNAERKRATEFLDNLRDKIRQPVTEYENREKARVKEREDAIEEIRSLAQLSSQIEPAEYQARIDRVEAISASLDFMEFTEKMQAMKDGAIALLTAQKIDREQAIADKARLEELERLNAERERAEREKKIAEEAAQKAKEEAERKAQAELDRVAREAAEVKRQAEEAERKAKAEKEAAEIAAKAEQERLEREAKAAIEKAKADAQAAIEAERKKLEAERIAAEKKAAEEAAAEALRQADEAHRARVLGEIKEDVVNLVGAGGSPTEIHIAALVFESITSGKIRHVEIKF